MAQWWQILLGLWTLMSTLAGDKMVNICMNAKHHKPEPGPEDMLYLECTPWEDNTCCTFTTSWEAHLQDSVLFNFSLMHCGLLTPVCQKHFTQAICFHECSPNLGPWIQPVVPNRQEERVWGVPLCWEDCVEWWKDCQSSYTCKSNWRDGWDWSQGKNRCPAQAPCRPFPDYFPTPLTCVKRYGATHSRPVLSAGTVDGVCRSGLSPPRATPTWKWPFTLPALPQPGAFLHPHSRSFVPVAPFLKAPFFYPYSLVLLGHGHLLPRAIQVGTG